MKIVMMEMKEIMMDVMIIVKKRNILNVFHLLQVNVFIILNHNDLNIITHTNMNVEIVVNFHFHYILRMLFLIMLTGQII
jgi:hypothetical protein